MIRTKARRLAAASALAAALVGSVATSSAAPASAGTVSPQYVAGAAEVIAFGYSVPDWAKQWGCVYAGWAQPSKYYSCDLYTGDNVTLLQDHDGNWTGSKLTKKYQWIGQNTIYCARSSAGYNDGSGSARQTKCG